MVRVTAESSLDVVKNDVVSLFNYWVAFTIYQFAKLAAEALVCVPHPASIKLLHADACHSSCISYSGAFSKIGLLRECPVRWS